MLMGSLGLGNDGPEEIIDGRVGDQAPGGHYSQLDLNTSGVPVREVEIDPGVLAFVAEEGWFD